jgi:hypothetical protein
MKKSKFLVLGLIVLMLTGGLALVSCGRAGCDGAGTCERKDNKGSICTDSSCALYKKSGDQKCDC